MENVFTVTRDLLERTKEELESLPEVWDVGSSTYILYHQIDQILVGPDLAFSTGGERLQR